jgi:hypothetical protein
MDWIEQQERLLDIQQNPYREPMKYILCHFIYINQQQYIEKIITDELSFTEEYNPEILKESRIPSDKVLHMIQSKRYSTPTTKYIFKEAAMFHIHLEPENIQEFSSTKECEIDYKRFFHILPHIDDIIIPNSIFIFHTLNALYFTYQEVPLKNTHQLRSVIKNKSDKKIENHSFATTECEIERTSMKPTDKRITKSVRFSNKKNNTKKIFFTPFLI